MTRVKRGLNSKKKHKKILNLCKGYIGRRNNVYKISKQAVLKSLVYSHHDRKLKKRIFKSNWILCINFFLRVYGFKYSFLIKCLKKYLLCFNKKIIFLISICHFEFIKFINVLFFYYCYYF